MPPALNPTEDSSVAIPPATAALVLVSTPLGNLNDFSPRAAASCADSDAILCEDTRTSAVLLRHHGIKTRLLPLHEHNESARLPELIADMQSGRRYALISDAGTPLLSDPGYRLVRACIAAGLAVTAVPGPNAATMALTLSGFPPIPHMVFGFLPPKPGPRRAAFSRIHALESAGLSATLIFYESPHRLPEFLSEAAEIFGPRPTAICRELTKFYEEVRRADLPSLAAYYAANVPRGEITVVIAPSPDEPTTATGLTTALRSALSSMSLKDAVTAVTAATGLPKKQVYAAALALTSES